MGLRDTMDRDRMGQGARFNSQSNQPPGHYQTEESDAQEVAVQPVWKNAWVALTRDQPKIVLVGGLLIAIYALRGLREVLGLIF
jgi:hypothetical protein